MADAKTTGLYPKLLEAQRIAAKVEKRGQNTEQRYAYALASDVIEEAQRALHEAGLVGYMAPGEIRRHEIEARSGAAGLFVEITSEIVIVDPESGDDLRIAFTGTGTDYPGDKAIYKAQTGAAKYAYASVLGIPFGDDPEEDAAGAGQERAAGLTSGPEASAAQKRAITTILNAANVEREFQRKIVHAIGGEPLTKKGASAILDRIGRDATGDDPGKRALAVAKLIEDAGVTADSDVPGVEAADAEAAQAQAELGDDDPFAFADDPGPEDEGS